MIEIGPQFPPFILCLSLSPTPWISVSIYVPILPSTECQECPHRLSSSEVLFWDSRTDFRKDPECPLNMNGFVYIHVNFFLEIKARSQRVFYDPIVKILDQHIFIL